MSERVENTRDLLIHHWFNNSLKNRKSKNILLVDDSIKNFQVPRSKAVNKYSRASINYINTNNDNAKWMVCKINSNIDCSDSFEKMYKMNDVLYIPKESDFYKNIELYIKEEVDDEIKDISIDEQDRCLYYIEQKDPLDFINSTSLVDLYNWLKHHIIDRNSAYALFYGKYINLIFHKIDLTERDILEDILYSDICLLKKNNILKSRLAVIIYRIAMVKLKASIIEVGRYFSKKIGSKSKTLNYNLIEKYYYPKIQFSIADSVSRKKTDSGEKANAKKSKAKDVSIWKKNFKAYDLSYNETEEAIRKEIAINLIALNIPYLDTKAIAKATNLEVQEVSKLF